MIQLKKTGRQMTLKCEKQKDAEQFHPIHLDLDVVRFNDGQSSCVVATGVTTVDDSVAGNERRILECLRQSADSRPQSAMLRQMSGLKARTFYRHLEALVEKQLVARLGQGRLTRYRLNDQNGR